MFLVYYFCQMYGVFLFFHSKRMICIKGLCIKIVDHIGNPQITWLMVLSVHHALPMSLQYISIIKQEWLTEPNNLISYFPRTRSPAMPRAIAINTDDLPRTKLIVGWVWSNLMQHVVIYLLYLCPIIVHFYATPLHHLICFTCSNEINQALFLITPTSECC